MFVDEEELVVMDIVFDIVEVSKDDEVMTSVVYDDK